MAKKKSIRVDFMKSCITYNKLNMIAKIAISGIEKMIKRVRMDYDTASYARAYQTRAGFYSPIFILVTSRQRRVIKIGRGFPRPSISR